MRANLTNPRTNQLKQVKVVSNLGGSLQRAFLVLRCHLK